MSWFTPQNPGIGGLDELTSAEEEFLTTFAGLSFSEGNVLKIVSGVPAWGAVGGTGDVVGPVSAVNNRVAFFDGLTGKLIKDSGLTLSGSNTGDQTITLTGGVTGSGTGSFAATVVTNANLTGPVTSTGNATAIADAALSIAKTSGLQTALDLKAPLASPTFTTQITTPLVLGGTATTSDLILQTTSGIGATGADMHFLVGNNGATEAMTILNDSNVGIGTNNPTYKLDVAGAIRTTGVLNLNGAVSAFPLSMKALAGGDLMAFFDSANVQKWHLTTIGGDLDFTESGVANYILHLKAGGNVGIGLVNPTEKLMVAGNVSANVDSTYTLGTSALYWSNTYTDVLTLNATASISGATAGVLAVTGNVGIGVTPTALLHLKAGTATANTAPIKLTSGTLNTTAEIGTHEYNNDHHLTNWKLVRYSVGGTITESYTDSSVGGTETDIRSFTTIANTLGTNGDKLVASYSGNFVTVGTELTQLKAYFGGTVIWDSTALAPATGTTSWNVDVKIIRVSATVVRYSVTLNTSGATGYTYATCGELTGLTLSNTNIIKLTGTSSGVGSGAGDIVGKFSFIKFEPAA